MSWRRLAVLAFAITLLIFAGVARGQGRYEPAEQGRQSLPSDLASPEPPGLDGPKSVAESYSKAKNPAAGRPADIRKGAPGTGPKRVDLGPISGQYAVPQAKGPQIGVSGSGLLGLGNPPSSGPGSTSFLDGYFIRSLHDDGLARKKPGE